MQESRVSARPRDPDDRSGSCTGTCGSRNAAPAVPQPGPSAPTPCQQPPLGFRTPPPLEDRGLPCPVFDRPSFALPPSLPSKPVPLDPPFQVPPEGSASGLRMRVQGQGGPPPKRPKPSRSDGSGMEAIRSHSAANSKVAMELMMQLLAFLGSESGTFTSLQSAVHYHHHVRRVLAGFAATTVIRYITTFNNFAKTCEDLDVCILEITEVQAADILVTLQLQKREDPALGSSATTCIKAIRWVRRNTQCCVFEVFFGELISSFLRSKLPKDRCESVPLPLFALVQWERRILQRNTPLVDVILLGAILLTVWASLRFSDSQRVEWSSFAFDVVSLRGVAYQTKVSHQGQPFGLITAGFLHHGGHSWVAKWLRVLDSVASSEIRDFGVAPSFLFPALDESAELVRPLSPMSYASCLKWLRYYLQFPWLDCPPDVPVSNYTVHSMKCSLLSYMLEVPSILGPDRDSQGHHRGSSRELYSRDDVLGALRAQQQLRAAVQSGLRPRTPQHRGAQLPMPAIPVSIESFRKDISTAPWGFFMFDVLHPGSLPWTPDQATNLPVVASQAPAATLVPQAALPTFSASTEDTGSEEDSASEPELEGTDPLLGCPEEVCMFASTGVVHATASSSGKTLCGIHMSGSRWQEVLSISSRHSLCRRQACVKAFAALERA